MRYWTDIVVDQMIMLGSSPGGGQGGGEAGGYSGRGGSHGSQDRRYSGSRQASHQRNPGASVTETEDDLPF